MRVVLDANVIVSALISQHGAPKQVLDLWRTERLSLITTVEIIGEIARVLRYDKVRRFHRLSEKELDEFVSLLEANSEVVVTPRRLFVSNDDSDNRYIECAVAGKAQYLITGDTRHLRPIKEFQGVRILSPASFLTLMQMDEA